MDLNLPPPEFDDDVFDLDNVTCTQVFPEFGNPQPNEKHEVLPEASDAGLAEADPAVPEVVVPTVSEIRLSLEQSWIDDGDGAGNQLAVEEEEVWSTPPMPHIGKSFASLNEARLYYNEYAKKIGFSIRTCTSYRGSVTREKQKVQYVCNKEGFGKKVKPAQEDAIDCYSDNDEAREADGEEEEEDGQGEKRKKPDGCKKRKREKMIHTNCKARMVVKLIGSRWQAIYFVADHNHDLVLKPSLKKFLRSHRGMPSQEKDFIGYLHGCNLSTGRIMQLMSEFYGSAQLVPYEAKQVSNFRSSIHKVEKFKDMQETLDYFRSLKEEDPDFFYKIKLDDNHKVQNLFWVDSAARRAYREAYSDCISFDAK